MRILLAALLFSGAALVANHGTPTTEALMRDAAQVLTQSLDRVQRSYTLFPFEADHRADWHYFPEGGFTRVHGYTRNGITFGQMTVIPVGQAFVSREAPARLANTLMGVWLLFGGVGIWVSGQIGALAEPFGIRAVYLGIAAGCTVAAIAAFACRRRIMGLLEPPSRRPSRTAAPR